MFIFYHKSIISPSYSATNMVAFEDVIAACRGFTAETVDIIEPSY